MPLLAVGRGPERPAPALRGAFPADPRARPEGPVARAFAPAPQEVTLRPYALSHFLRCVRGDVQHPR
jgi:hypothetical protein